MRARLKNWLKRIGVWLALILVTIFCVRAWDARNSPPLKLWLTEAPHELSARQIDAANWDTWVAAENKVFDKVRTRVTDQLPPKTAIRATATSRAVR